MAPIGQLQLLQDLRLLAEGRQISYADVVPVLAPCQDIQMSWQMPLPLLVT